MTFCWVWWWESKCETVRELQMVCMKTSFARFASHATDESPSRLECMMMMMMISARGPHNHISSWKRERERHLLSTAATQAGNTHLATRAGATTFLVDGRFLPTLLRAPPNEKAPTEEVTNSVKHSKSRDSDDLLMGPFMMTMMNQFLLCEDSCSHTNALDTGVRCWCIGWTDVGGKELRKQVARRSGIHRFVCACLSTTYLPFCFGYGS